MTQTATDPTTPAPRPPLWKKVLAAYRQRPLMLGFFTLLGVIILAGGISSLTSGGASGSRQGSGPQRDQDASIRFVTESLQRLDGSDGWLYTEMLRDSLNDWCGRLNVPINWRPDAYAINSLPSLGPLAGLIATAREVPGKGPSGKPRVELNYGPLARKDFTFEDARVIQGAAWMRDVCRTVGDRLPEEADGVKANLALAAGLFDWTMRNVALDENDGPSLQLPWESLLWGKAQANGRAWVFMSLCRQRDLEVVMLAYREGSSQQAAYKQWIPALLLNNELYLFDHTLGLPIPGPGGGGIATLKQAMHQPEVFTQLDVGTRKYPLRAADLKRGVVAYVDGSPHLLCWRMRKLQDELEANRLVLSVSLANLHTRLIKALHNSAGIERAPAGPKPPKTAKSEPAKQPGDDRFGTALWPWPLACLAQCRLARHNELNDPRQADDRQMALEAQIDLTVAVPFNRRLYLFQLPGFENKGETYDREGLFDLLPSEDGKNRSSAERRRVSDPLLQSLKRERQQQRTGPQTPQSLDKRIASGFLWRGRMLEFKGVYQDRREAGALLRRGAPNVYQTGRLSEGQLDRMFEDLKKDRKQLEAAFKKDVNVNPAEAQKHADGANRRAFQIKYFHPFRRNRQLVRAMASYRLGAVTYERGDYADAVEYFRLFREQELQATVQPLVEEEKRSNILAAKKLKIDPKQLPRSHFEALLPIWDLGSRYHLARSLEALGGPESLREAIQLYEADTSSSRHGSLLRAQRLKQKLSQKKSSSEKSSS